MIGIVSNKLKRNRVTTKLWVLFLLVLTFISVPLSSLGALPSYTSDPSTHYSRHGTDIQYMSNHEIVFGTRIQPATSDIRTRIIGYTTTITVNGKSAKLTWKQGNSYKDGWDEASPGFIVNKETSGSYGYWMYRIRYATLQENVKKVNATVANYMAEGNYDVNIRFDAITEVYSSVRKVTLDGPNYTLSESRAALKKYGLTQTLLDDYYGMLMKMNKEDLPVVNYVSKSISFPQGSNYYSGGIHYVKPNKEVNVTTVYKSNLVNMERQYLRVGDEIGGSENVDDFTQYFTYSSSSSPYGSFTTHNGTGDATILTGAGSTANNADRNATVRFDFNLDNHGDHWFVYGEAKNERNMYAGGYSAEYKELYQLKVDGEAPTISGRLSSNWRNTDAVFTPAVRDLDSGIDNIKLYRGSTLLQNVSPSSRDTYYALNEQKATSSQTYKVIMTDNVGNSTTSEWEVNIDKVDPSLTATPSASGWTNGDVAISYSTSDSGGSGFDYIKLPNGTTSTSASGSYTVSSSGTYSFVSYDNAGNSTTKTVTVNIDKTSPTASISQTPTSWTNGNVTLTLSNIADTGGSGIDYVRLPNGNIHSSSSNVSQTVSSNGSYTFSIYDHAGNRTDKTISVTNIDKTNPVGNLSASSTSWTNGNVTLTLSSISDSESGVDYVRLPNGSTQTGTSNKTYTVSSNGSYSFTIYDKAGNTLTRSISVTNIDKNDPTASLTQTPTGWTDGNVTLNLSSISDTGGSGLKSVTLPNGNVETNFGNKTYTVTSDGTYSFKIRDNANNETVKTITVSNIDKVAPTASLNQTPTTPTNGNVTLNLTSIADSGGSGLKSVKLPNGTVQTSFENKSYVVSANGTYRFEIEDRAGNITIRSISVSNIDKAAPTGNVSQSPGGWTNGNVTLSLTAVSDTGGSGLKNILLPDRSTYVTGTNATYIATSNGTYTFTIYDNAGNATNKAITVSTIDRTLPTVTLSQTPTSWTNGVVKLTLSSIADGNSGVKQIQKPDGSIVSPASSITYDVSANGTYTFKVTDNAGNVLTKSISVTNIEKNDPSVAFSPNGVTWKNTSQVVAISANDTGGSGVSYWRYRRSSNDGASYGAWSGNITSSSSNVTVSGHGLHKLQVEVVDKAGNRAVYTSNTYELDTVLPTASISASTTAYTNGNVTLSLTSSDADSGIASVKKPDGTSVSASSTSYTVTSNGTYAFDVLDNAGNKRTVSISVSNIDKTKPVGTLTQTPTGWTNGNVTLNLSAVSDAGGSGLKHIKLPNGTYTTGTNASQVISANGTYSFVLYDNAGNQTTLSLTVTNIDKVKPNGTVSFVPGTSRLTIRFTGEDSLSGIQHIRLPNGNTVTASTADYAVTSPGTYTATIVDRAGNTQAVSTTVTLPSVGIVKEITSWTNATGYNLIASGTPKYGATLRLQAPFVSSVWTSANILPARITQNGTYTFQYNDGGLTGSVSIDVENFDRMKPLIRIEEKGQTEKTTTINVKINDIGDKE